MINGWLKKICSHSERETQCLSQLLLSFPASHWNPVQSARISFGLTMPNVYYGHTHQIKAFLWETAQIQSLFTYAKPRKNIIEQIVVVDTARHLPEKFKRGAQVLGGQDRVLLHIFIQICTRLLRLFVRLNQKMAMPFGNYRMRRSMQVGTPFEHSSHRPLKLINPLAGNQTGLDNTCHLPPAT